MDSNHLFPNSKQTQTIDHQTKTKPNFRFQTQTKLNRVKLSNFPIKSLEKGNFHGKKVRKNDPDL